MTDFWLYSLLRILYPTHMTTATADLISALFGFTLLIAFAWMFIAGFFRSPFVPSNRPTTDRLLKVAKIKPKERVVDLGCGDGRIVFAAERQYGARAEGYEISIIVWLIALTNRLFKGAKSPIYRRNFFQADLRQADVVICYLLPEVMRRLAPKFRTELRPGARVVSAAFRLPGWKITKEYARDGRVTPIFIYKR